MAVWTVEGSWQLTCSFQAAHDDVSVNVLKGLYLVWMGTTTSSMEDIVAVAAVEVGTGLNVRHLMKELRRLF